MIKLFAIDLDGTMYTTDRRITIVVRNAIKDALNKGIQPIIVTGRGRRGVESALNSLGMDLPFICNAGALLCTGINGKEIHAWTFHKHEELMHVIEFTRKHNTGLIAEPLHGLPLWFGPDEMNTVMDPQTVKEAGIRSFEPEKDFNQPLLKVTITAYPELLQEAERLIRTSCPSIHQVFSGIQYIDLTADGANKGTALEAYATYLGLFPSEIAAIGDQPIDFDMLEYAGLPIAMSNGVHSLKGIAHWIAPSNDEDGVAWAIQKMLKKNLENSQITHS